MSNIIPTKASLKPFELERYFSKYEFNAKYLLCCSDSQPLSMQEVLSMMDDDIKSMWNNLQLNYTESQGLPALRHIIATSLYTTMKPDEIIIAAPQEAIFLTMNAIFDNNIDDNDDSIVVCMYPAYQSLYSIAHSLGLTVTWWLPRESTDGTNTLYYSTDDLEKIVDGKKVKLVIVNTPHNPTGWLATLNEWNHILDICRNKSTYPGGAYLFSDEMYRGLEINQHDQLPTAADTYHPRGISLCGMSKSFGGPGLRIGWIATQCIHLRQRIAQLKDYTSICASAPSEMLSLAILSKRDAVIDKQMSIVRCNLKVMDEFVSRWGGVVKWKSPRAGTIAFPKIQLLKNNNSSNSMNTSVELFCDELVNKYGVMLLPSSVYQYDDDNNSNAANIMHSEQEQQEIMMMSSVLNDRCRFGYGRENFPEVLQQFENALINMGYSPSMNNRE